MHYACKSLTGRWLVVVWSNSQARGSIQMFGVCFCQGCPWASNLPRIQRGIRHLFSRTEYS